MAFTGNPRPCRRSTAIRSGSYQQMFSICSKWSNVCDRIDPQGRKRNFVFVLSKEKSPGDNQGIELALGESGTRPKSDSSPNLNTRLEPLMRFLLQGVVLLYRFAPERGEVMKITTIKLVALALKIIVAIIQITLLLS